MSDDLQSHALNPTPDSMSITNINDLKLMCTYVVYQAVFYHDWVHWNGFDDFFPALFYRAGNIYIYIYIYLYLYI